MFAPNNGIVYPIIKRYLSINPLYEWDDLQQEAYISKMYTDKHHDETKGQYNTLLGIAVNHQLWKAVNHNKNNTTSSLNVRIDDTDDEVIDLIEDNTIDLNERLFQYELRTLLERKINSYLNDKERNVLLWYYYDDISLDSIAILLDCSRANIQRYLHQAELKLKRDIDIQDFYRSNINPNYYG